MAENKTSPTGISVAAFIAGLPDETRRADAKALVRMMQNATGEKAKMWGPSIIGCGCYHYTYESGRQGDWPLACFSPRQGCPRGLWIDRERIRAAAGPTRQT